MPRRRRVLGGTLSHGVKRGNAEAADIGSLRVLVAAADAGEVPLGAEAFSATLPANGSTPAWTFTLDKDVIEVVLHGDDTDNSLAGVKSKLLETSMPAGLRLRERK